MEDSRREYEMTKISIVIPVKNESEKIERCLEAVFNFDDEIVAVGGR